MFLSLLQTWLCASLSHKQLLYLSALLLPFFYGSSLTNSNCTILRDIPPAISCFTHIMKDISSLLLALETQTLSSLSKIDEVTLPYPTIRHPSCELLLGVEGRCQQCILHRATLHKVVSRKQAQQLTSCPAMDPQSHANYCYLPSEEKNQ